MVISESPIPSPINRMTLRAWPSLIASRIAVDWSPSSRRAPPGVVRSPSAARLTVSPTDFPPLSLLQAARGSTATAPSTVATVRYVLTDTREIERDRGERSLAAARTLGEDVAMAHAAAFNDVRRAVAGFGPRATVITVAESLRPHVVTAVVGVDGESLLIDVGAGTRANLTAHPDLVLAWNPPGDGEYQLILDGTAEQIGAPDERGCQHGACRRGGRDSAPAGRPSRRCAVV